MSNLKFEKEIKGYTLNKIFGTEDVRLEYYSTGKRNIIVFQLKEEKYIYWAVTGGEDHRIIVSAKGPFDNKLSQEDSGSPVKWSDVQVNEDEFMVSVKMERSTIMKTFEKYILLWLDDVLILSNKKAEEKPGFWNDAFFKGKTIEEDYYDTDSVSWKQVQRKAKLVSVYVNKDTIEEGQKQNSTKRLVYELDSDLFIVVKTFSLEKQDEDFNAKYRSIKLWENAAIKDVAAHWNTHSIKDDEIKDFLSLDTLIVNIQTLKKLFAGVEVDVSLTGYSEEEVSVTEEVKINKKDIK